MDKKYFVLKLVASRPDFMHTMTDLEKATMQEHISYWQPYLQNGTMLVFGPVLDPAGPYGLGIIAVENEAEVEQLINKDPACRINRYEYYPMMAVVAPK